jgi:hypothetical protein
MAADGTKSIMQMLVMDIRHLEQQYAKVHGATNEGLGSRTLKNLERMSDEAKGEEPPPPVPVFHDSDGVKLMCPYLHEFCFGVALRFIFHTLKNQKQGGIHADEITEARIAVVELQISLEKLLGMASDVRTGLVLYQ